MSSSQTWQLSEAAICSGIGGVTSDPISDAGFYVGCADGSLAWFEMNAGLVEEGGEPVAGVVGSERVDVGV